MVCELYINILIKNKTKQKKTSLEHLTPECKNVFKEWQEYVKKQASLRWILTGQIGDNLKIKTNDNNGF